MNQLISDVKTHKGLVRKINEDACLELADRGVWLLADGMGGHAAGDIASHLVVDSVRIAVQQSSVLSVQTISDALHQANTALCQYSAKQLQGNTAGSTVVALLIDKLHFHFLWAGDSRGYLLRSDNLCQITRDHSQINHMIDYGLLSRSEAEQHELTNVITRAVGVNAYLSIDIVSAVWHPGDLFLLCSDGLNKELSDPEICQYLLHHRNLAEANRALLRCTLAAGARDNVSCILVKIDNDSQDLN